MPADPPDPVRYMAMRRGKSRRKGTSVVCGSSMGRREKKDVRYSRTTV
jgi:hypothetical protein